MKMSRGEALEIIWQNIGNCNKHKIEEKAKEFWEDVKIDVYDSCHPCLGKKKKGKNNTSMPEIMSHRCGTLIFTWQRKNGFYITRKTQLWTLSIFHTCKMGCCDFRLSLFVYILMNIYMNFLISACLMWCQQITLFREIAEAWGPLDSRFLIKNIGQVIR